MSATCGVQCALNMSSYGFAFGERACWWEAIFHLTSILAQFVTLTLMAYDSWRTVLHGKSLSVTQTLLIQVGMWVTIGGGLALCSLGSPIYMAESGVFCFFAFGSLLMLVLVFPTFALSVAAMAFFYWKIFRKTKEALAQLNAHHASVGDQRQKMQLRLTQKLCLLYTSPSPRD